MPARSTLQFASVLILISNLVISSVRAENWPQWRGSRLNGISTESNLATSWDSKKNVAWRLKLPGRGGATPIVWEDKVFVTSVEGKQIVLLAISTDGKKLWQQTIGNSNKLARVDEGDYASPTPCTDGKHVWAFSGAGELHCFTVDGKRIWSRDLQKDYGKFEIQFGLSSTPILDNGRIYLQLIHGVWSSDPSKGTVACLDGLSGKEIWKRDRTTPAYSECKQVYSSPTIYRDDKQAFLLSHGADFIIAHDLESGKEIWRCGGFNSGAKYHETLRFVSSPVSVPGYILAPSAKTGPIFCLRPDGKGDITEKASSFHWKLNRKTPDVSSPLVVDGLVYLVQKDGLVDCIDAKTGESYYEERTISDRHRASPVYADGKIYSTARKGIITVLKAGTKFKILSQNDMGEPISASPAISNGRIYIRTFDALYSIENK